MPTEAPKEELRNWFGDIFGWADDALGTVEDAVDDWLSPTQSPDKAKVHSFGDTRFNKGEGSLFSSRGWR